MFFCFLFLFCYNNIILAILYLCFLTEFTPSYSLTHNGEDAPQNLFLPSEMTLDFITVHVLMNGNKRGVKGVELLAVFGTSMSKGFLDSGVPEAIKGKNILGQRLRPGVFKEKQIFWLVLAKSLLSEGALPRDRGICRHMYV